MTSVDVLVAGSGPAGWALAHACALRGLDTAIVAPHPHRTWHQTFGLWQDECVGAVPAVTAAAVAFGHREHRLDRRYVVLDNAATLAAFASAPVTVLRDRMVGHHAGDRGSTVELASGKLLATGVVVDATGSPRLHGAAEQTAVGVLVEPAAARALVADREAVFMDWRDGRGTFLYAVPVGGRVLVEETSLAARPGMPFAALRSALHNRLRAAGIEPDPATVEERVRFPLDPPLPRGGGAIAFGAAAALVHPATGYSVGTSLQLAPAVADALAVELPRGPRAAVRAARRIVWPRAARAVHLLRRKGLRSLLHLPQDQLPRFFDNFFALPADLQRAYLSDRTDVTATAAAMKALFMASPWRTRRHLVG